ncbi:putative inner membrane protein [Yersinia aldovae]|uniref:Inner membrane protein n=2 Tax=Yersinia aldovae TaxID=29483 RepID=A0ABP1YMN9_YERAL|nr:putative inner membrane protein [Yersinia aldovae]CNK69954.1 putative inner membrane protein [Yersinia aldovae]
MLSLDRAKVYITINMEKYNNEIGYTINAIGIVTSALQMNTGFGLIIKSGFTLGKLAGAHLAVSGASTAAENFLRLLGDNEYTGVMEKGYRATAKFMGFDPKFGSMAYHSVDMASSLYGMLALSLKPDVLRLFRYIPSDYYRNITKMSQGALFLKFAGAGNKIRIISDINNREDANYF